MSKFAQGLFLGIAIGILLGGMLSTFIWVTLT